MADTERLEAVCETLATRGYALDRGDGRAVATPNEGTETVGVPGPPEVAPAPRDPTALVGVVGRASAAGSHRAVRRALGGCPGAPGRADRPARTGRRDRRGADLLQRS
jgi:hypothetical protein